MIVAVDVGNTAVKVAWHPTEQPRVSTSDQAELVTPRRLESGAANRPWAAPVTTVQRYPLKDPAWAIRCTESIRQLQREWIEKSDVGERANSHSFHPACTAGSHSIGNQRLNPDQGKNDLEVRLASVNRVAHALLDETLAQTPPVPSRGRWRSIRHQDLGIAIRTDAPEKVGIDRLLGAWGAIRWYPLPAMVVDAGTTVTADYVDREGNYWGGAIVPGLQMQTHSLAAGTDLLPRLDWSTSDDLAPEPSGPQPNVPEPNVTEPGGPERTGPRDRPPHTVTGRNTVDAIRLGVLSSVVGSILRLADLYDRPPTVVLTGGDAPFLIGKLHGRLPVVHHPQLVCHSLLSLPLPPAPVPTSAVDSAD